LFFDFQEIVNDPNKKDLLTELINNGQVSNDMKKKLFDEMTKKPIDPSTLLNVLQNSKELPTEVLDKVLQNVENMSGKELNDLAKKLDKIPPGMKQRVMKEMMKNIQDLDSKTQANIVREMMKNSVDMDPKVVSDLIVKNFFYQISSYFLVFFR
jgi:Asp-tRNA(Asn)/Glu-tRNA(Gln) amidotransferase B subunit